MSNSKLADSLILALTVCALTACGEAHHEKSKIVAKPSEVPVVRAQELQLKRTLEIPGELRAFQNVAIEAKVQGYISWIGVDRGSKLKRNDKMLTIFCPELEEH